MSTPPPKVKYPQYASPALAESIEQAMVNEKTSPYIKATIAAISNDVPKPVTEYPETHADPILSMERHLSIEAPNPGLVPPLQPYHPIAREPSVAPPVAAV